jgi:hypothetical protein
MRKQYGSWRVTEQFRGRTVSMKLHEVTVGSRGEAGPDALKNVEWQVATFITHQVGRFSVSLLFSLRQKFRQQNGDFAGRVIRFISRNDCDHAAFCFRRKILNPVLKMFLLQFLSQSGPLIEIRWKRYRAAQPIREGRSACLALLPVARHHAQLLSDHFG